MKPILRSTAVLSGSSLINIAIGLVSAKAWATFLGPSGLGFMGLLQSLAGLGSLIVGLGIGTGLVRMGANALAQDETERLAALRWGAWLVFGVLGGLGCLILILFREPISAAMLGSSDHSLDVVLMAPAVLFLVASNLQGSTLNAYHRVSALAKTGILVNVLGTGASLILIWKWSDGGIAPAVIVSALLSWAVSRYFLNRNVGAIPVRPARRQITDAIRSLVRFGVPFTGSMLLGTGIQLLIPVLVLHAVGQEDLGFYRAASVIALTYLGFLYTALAQDYYPRISAVSHQPTEVIKVANQQLHLMLLIALPMILGVLALVPYLVPIVYSNEFRPTTGILEWFLIADIVKIPSWVFGFVILAKCGSSKYFMTELIVGVTTLVTCWLGMRWFGLNGIGIAFVVTYAAYCGVTWLVVRREIGFLWTRQNKLLLLGGLVAAFLVRGLSMVHLDDERTAVALLLAFIAGLASLRVIWTDMDMGSLPMLQRFRRQTG